MKLWLTNFINGRVRTWPSSPPNPLKIPGLYPASRARGAETSSGGEGHRKGAAWGPSLWAHLPQGGGPRNPDRACECTGIQSNPPTMMLTLNVLSLQPSAEDLGTIILLCLWKRDLPKVGRSSPGTTAADRGKIPPFLLSVEHTTSFSQPDSQGRRSSFFIIFTGTFQTPEDSCLKHTQ